MDAARRLDTDIWERPFGVGAAIAPAMCRCAGGMSAAMPTDDATIRVIDAVRTAAALPFDALIAALHAASAPGTSAPPRHHHHLAQRGDERVERKGRRGADGVDDADGGVVCRHGGAHPARASAHGWRDSGADPERSLPNVSIESPSGIHRTL